MTGYGDRFTGGFYDAAGATINIVIQQKDYTGTADTLTLSADNPVIINRPKGDLLTNIFGTGCRISVVNNGSFLQYSELFGTPERQHYVKVTRVVGATTTTLFEGFVLPQMYNQNLRINSTVVIPANDQLSSLKQRKSTLLRGSDNYIKLIDLVKEIVWDTGLNKAIYVKNGIYNTHYTASYSASYTPFDEAYIDKALFLDDDNEPKDSHFVLNTILKIFGSRLYYDNGRWFIDRVKNLSNLTSYKTYIPDNSTGTTTVASRTTELSNQKIINNGGSLEYESGVKTFELGLNTDLFDNLVNSSFKDLKAASSVTYYAIPTSGVDDLVGGWTYPNRYEWVHNIDDALGNPILSIKNAKFNDANIIHGIHWDCDRGNVNQVFPAFASLTTRFLIDYNDNIPKENYSLKIRFKYSMLGLETFSAYNRNYRSQFTLRYKDSSGNFRSIYLDGSGDAQIESSISNVNNLYITTVQSAETIKNSSEPSAFIINQNIFLGDIIDTIKGHISSTDDVKFIEFYLDFYLLQEESSGNWAPLQTKFGDLEVTTSVDIEENIIEGTIEDNYNTKLDLSLDLYDSRSCNIKNTLYLKDGNSYIPSGWYRWMEYDYTYHRHLQYMFLTDLIQNYNQNRYKLNLNVRPITVTDFKFGDLITYTHITKDAVAVDMILMGYDYNVKAFTYNLYLQEWTGDDGFYWEEFVGSGAVSLSASPTSFDIPTWGAVRSINITSDTDWTVSTVYDWIILDTVQGFGNQTIYFTVTEVDNPALGRTGSITIETLDTTVSVTIFINQRDTNDDEFYLE